jgi:hypothetical protein
MTDGEFIEVDTAEQVGALIKEARLARMQAEEAVQRIQQRIERLESLSDALDGFNGDNDRREPSGREGDLAATPGQSD